MADLIKLIDAAGPPLPLASMWDPDTERAIAELCQRTVGDAIRTHGEDTAAVRTILAMYAHAFMVGRDHARLGLMVPGHVGRSLQGLSLDDLTTIIIPDDLRDL